MHDQNRERLCLGDKLEEEQDRAEHSKAEEERVGSTEHHLLASSEWVRSRDCLQVAAEAVCLKITLNQRCTSAHHKHAPHSCLAVEAQTPFSQDRQQML